MIASNNNLGMGTRTRTKTKRKERTNERTNDRSIECIGKIHLCQAKPSPPLASKMLSRVEWTGVTHTHSSPAALVKSISSSSSSSQQQRYASDTQSLFVLPTFLLLVFFSHRPRSLPPSLPPSVIHSFLVGIIPLSLWHTHRHT